MKGSFKRIICLALAVFMLASMTVGCGKDDTSEPEQLSFDPAAYVKGGLDAVYLGVYSDYYLDVLGAENDESCAEAYERGMAVSLDVFAGYFNISLDKCSDETRTELLELMKSLYGDTNYEILSAEESGDGYTVKVKVYPIATVSTAAQEDYPIFADTAARRLAEGELEKGDRAFEEWWAKSIMDMVRIRISEGKYLEPVEVSVEITKTSGGEYILSSEALAEIDKHIVAYPV